MIEIAVQCIDARRSLADELCGRISPGQVNTKGQFKDAEEWPVRKKKEDEDGQ